MRDPVDDGSGKAETAVGRVIADLAVFLDDMVGVDFPATLQVDRVGKYTSGKGRGEEERRNKPEGMRHAGTHETILPRRPPGPRRTLRLDAQSGYSLWGSHSPDFELA